MKIDFVNNENEPIKKGSPYDLLLSANSILSVVFRHNNFLKDCTKCLSTLVSYPAKV